MQSSWEDFTCLEAMIGIMATNKRIISVVLSKSSKSVILSLILLLPIKHRSQRVKVGIQNN